MLIVSTINFVIPYDDHTYYRIIKSIIFFSCRLSQYSYKSSNHHFLVYLNQSVIVKNELINPQ